MAFINLLAAERAAQPGPRAHIATTLAASLKTVRLDVLPWLQYHTGACEDAFAEAAASAMRSSACA